MQGGVGAAVYQRCALAGRACLLAFHMLPPLPSVVVLLQMQDPPPEEWLTAMTMSNFSGWMVSFKGREAKERLVALGCSQPTSTDVQACLPSLLLLFASSPAVLWRRALRGS